MTLILVIILIVILFGGVGLGWRGGHIGNGPGIGIVGILLIILLVVFLTGNLGNLHL